MCVIIFPLSFSKDNRFESNYLWVQDISCTINVKGACVESFAWGEIYHMQEHHKWKVIDPFRITLNFIMDFIWIFECKIIYDVEYKNVLNSLERNIQNNLRNGNNEHWNLFNNKRLSKYLCNFFWCDITGNITLANIL